MFRVTSLTAINLSQTTTILANAANLGTKTMHYIVAHSGSLTPPLCFPDACLTTTLRASRVRRQLLGTSHDRSIGHGLGNCGWVIDAKVGWVAASCIMP